MPTSHARLDTTGVALASGSATDGWGEQVEGVGDVNGDGYDDLAVAAPDASSGRGRVYVFHGGPTGPDAVADATLAGDVFARRFGWGLGRAGDVNGDGYDDFLVVSDHASGTREGAWVVLGSPRGARRPTAALFWHSSHFTHTPALGIGDVNGDGYDDVRFDIDHQVRVHHGSSAGVSTTVARRLTHATAGMGLASAPAGDVNGDGYDDLVALEEHTASGAAFGSVYHLGSPLGLTGGVGRATLGGDVDSGVAGAADADGDGRPDVAVVEGDHDLLALFAGRAGAPPASTATWSEDYSAEAQDLDGEGLRFLGDTDGDGRAELVVADRAGFLHVFAGAAGGFDPVPVNTLAVAFQAWAPAGDLDGDGLADLAVVDDAGTLWLQHGATAPADLDADGSPRGDDCDDEDPSVAPTLPETCLDAVDNDCDGAVDEGCSGTTPLSTADADGHLAASAAGAHLGPVVALGDVTGDGRPDWAAAAPDAGGGAGAVYLRDGLPSSTDPASGAVAVLTGANTSAHLGYGLVSAGDQDGDGLGDLLVATDGAARHYLCEAPFAATVVSSSTCAGVIVNPMGTAAQGVTLAGEDLTGDGVPDVVLLDVRLTLSADAAGGGLLFAGPVTGTRREADADLRLTPNPSEEVTGRGGDVGDVDGDGLADLVVYDFQYREGRVAVVLGPWLASLSTRDADHRHEFPAADIAGDAPLRLLDADGDGATDVAARAEEGVVVLLEGLAGPDPALTEVARVVPSDGRAIGAALVSAGDVDGDGRDDLWLGDEASTAAGSDAAGVARGAAHLLFGPLSGTFDPADSPGHTLLPIDDEGLGAYLAAGRDLDGGGAPDLLVGAALGDGGAADGGDVFVLRGEGR